MTNEEIAYEVGRGQIKELKIPVRQHIDKLHDYIKDLQTGKEETEYIQFWKDEINNVRKVEDAFNIALDNLHNLEVITILSGPTTYTVQQQKQPAQQRQQQKKARTKK